MSIERIQMDVRDRARSLSGSLAGNSVAAGLVEFAGGWLAMDAAQAVASRVVGQILRESAPPWPPSASPRAGQPWKPRPPRAAGSFGGPVGTIVGIGVGLIVGVIVDWRLSKRFEAKIASSATSFWTRWRAGCGMGRRQTQGCAALLETTGLMDVQLRRRSDQEEHQQSAVSAESQFLAAGPLVLHPLSSTDIRWNFGDAATGQTGAFPALRRPDRQEVQ